MHLLLGILTSKNKPSELIYSFVLYQLSSHAPICLLCCLPEKSQKAASVNGAFQELITPHLNNGKQR